MQLRKKWVLMSLVPFVVALGLVVFVIQYQERDLSTRAHALMQSTYMSSKQAELRNYVAAATSAIQPLLDAGRHDEQTKAEAINILRRMDWGPDGYFFVYTMDGVNLMHPRQPELTGQNLLNYQDAGGNFPVWELVSQARAGGGFVTYAWRRPSTGQSAPKLGYVVAVAPWNWMVGTGLYLDEVHAAMDSLDQQIRTSINTTLLWIALIAAAGVLLIGAVGLALNVSEFRVTDAKMRLLAHQVVQSQEDERARLSRELHDSTGQRLVSAKLLLESGMEALGARGVDLPETLTRGVENVANALDELRDISHQLRPSELDMVGLDAALQQLCEECNQVGEGPKVQFRGEISHLDLSPEVKIALFRVGQEALTNARKHARADHIDVRLYAEKNRVNLHIEDDGGGFNVPETQRRLAGGIGLQNMRQRLDAIGGQCQILSDGKGTIVHVSARADAAIQPALHRQGPTETSEGAAHVAV